MVGCIPRQCYYSLQPSQKPIHYGVPVAGINPGNRKDSKE